MTEQKIQGVSTRQEFFSELKKIDVRNLQVVDQDALPRHQIVIEPTHAYGLPGIDWNTLCAIEEEGRRSPNPLVILDADEVIRATFNDLDESETLSNISTLLNEISQELYLIPLVATLAETYPEPEEKPLFDLQLRLLSKKAAVFELILTQIENWIDIKTKRGKLGNWLTTPLELSHGGAVTPEQFLLGLREQIEKIKADARDYSRGLNQG